MSWKDRPVLVTGAGGFIGSHLAERLVEQGARVRALVHYNALGRWGWLDRSPLVDRVEVIAGDIADRDCVLDVMRGIDTVFHLGALIAIPYSYRAPGSYLRTNVEGTINVLQAARDLGSRRVVHTSTSEVYGTARTVPISESHPLQGQSPYSASKIGADKMAEAFHLSFGVPVVTVRPFNTFGPRQSARAVIPTVISQALAGAARIRLGAVSPTRDFNYVTNTVDGFIRAAEVDAAIGQVVNLGSGREISVGELVQMVAGLVGNPLEVETDEQRLRPAGSEVERLLCDNGFATELLGWKPQVDLESGLEKTIEWLRDNMGLYRHNTYAI